MKGLVGCFEVRGGVYGMPDAAIFVLRSEQRKICSASFAFFWLTITFWIIRRIEVIILQLCLALGHCQEDETKGLQFYNQPKFVFSYYLSTQLPGEFFLVSCWGWWIMGRLFFLQINFSWENVFSFLIRLYSIKHSWLSGYGSSRPYLMELHCKAKSTNSIFITLNHPNYWTNQYIFNNVRFGLLF